MPATKETVIPVSPEVAAFAADQGVREVLLDVLEMTRRVFPSGQIGVEIDEDPEIAGDRHILVQAHAVRLPVSEALEARWEWHRKLMACCPAPVMCVFRLNLQIGS
jgi:hypothetical protein